MTERNYKKLQNGSDIRGVALGGVKGEAPNLYPEDAERIGAAFLLWLAEKTDKPPVELKISLGCDTRLSGKNLQHGLISGMAPYGALLLDCGLASTPAMFMSTVFPQYACDGAIMITASHLPANRNGFKFFDRGGGLNKSDISAILNYAGSDAALARLGEPTAADRFEMVLGKKTYPSVKADLMETYCAHLRKLIIDGAHAPESAAPGLPDRLRPLTGLSIVVDAGNGSAGFYARDVLAPLGADVSASQFLEPDGTFPNHAPNPEDKEAMHALSMAVLASGADLGLIFDTDVDRSAAVDGRGREIARNGIVALASALVAEDHPGTTVVTDSITSDQLSAFLETKLGLTHHRFKRGYKNVINEAIRLNEEGADCQLAIETSGHAAMKENYFLDDGAYLATRIVIKAARLRAQGKTLDSLLDGLTEPAEAREVRFPILCEDFASCGDRVLMDLQVWVSSEGAARGMSLVEPNYEGVRIAFGKDAGDGWCLLRKSLHDPILPLNLESDVREGCRKIADTLRAFLADYPDLDISNL